MLNNVIISIKIRIMLHDICQCLAMAMYVWFISYFISYQKLQFSMNFSGISKHLIKFHIL